MTDDNLKDLEYFREAVCHIINNNTDLMGVIFMNDDKATQLWKKTLLESNTKLMDVLAILEDLINEM